MLRTSIRATSRRSRSKPTSVCISACMLRTKRPATTSSSRQKAICAATSVLPTSAPRRPPAWPTWRACALMASVGATRVLRSAGRMPAARPQTIVTETANSSTRQSKLVSRSMIAAPPVNIDSSRSRPHAATSSPSAPPAHDEHHRFDEQLPDHAPASGAERGAHRNFALARARARDQQAGHVAAGDRQQHADHRQQHEEARREIAAQERHAAAGTGEDDALLLAAARDRRRPTRRAAWRRRDDAQGSAPTRRRPHSMRPARARRATATRCQAAAPTASCCPHRRPCWR